MAKTHKKHTHSGKGRSRSKLRVADYQPEKPVRFALFEQTGAVVRKRKRSKLREEGRDAMQLQRDREIAEVMRGPRNNSSATSGYTSIAEVSSDRRVLHREKTLERFDRKIERVWNAQGIPSVD